MGWETITLSEVADSGPKTGTTMEPGTQICKLLAVKPDTFQPSSLAFDLVVDEGGYKTRRVFPTLPDPTKQAWAANAAKHFASVLGVTQNDGETVIQMFSRAAQTPARFSIEVTKEEFTRRNGEPGSKNNVSWFSAQAVA